VTIEPAPSRFGFPDPRDYGEEDLVAVGGDLSPGTILAGYRQGLFPMHLEDGRLGWWSPVERGVIPLDRFQISKSLRRSLRRFRVTFDQDLAGVIEGCADPDRPNGWITSEIKAAYAELGRLGWVHSIETWTADGELAGGLYGVKIGGLFAGESMFSEHRDASKVALVALVGALSAVPSALLDVQWATPHLKSLGAIAVDRPEYFRRLARALRAPRVDGPWRAQN
jgi:leucyl/phenylalanyl-tRNA--protein transferase